MCTHDPDVGFLLTHLLTHSHSPNSTVCSPTLQLEAGSLVHGRAALQDQQPLSRCAMCRWPPLLSSSNAIVSRRNTTASTVGAVKSMEQTVRVIVAVAADAPRQEEHCTPVCREKAALVAAQRGNLVEERKYGAQSDESDDHSSEPVPIEAGAAAKLEPPFSLVLPGTTSEREE
ncbi:hypothetical protein BCV70DRAFT_206908 [Testicularia cyperi]|uniref:Uncharacterized protein n=1 Tax=Testicularia cyperi TaxID=1882483 RepID=A0A317XLT7_9BASI|nr:hypothetical protein BCV70DRAFT_206908 [Testicularia cyperi]